LIKKKKEYKSKRKRRDTEFKRGKKENVREGVAANNISTNQ
jgi:hypothetical protein